MKKSMKRALALVMSLSMLATTPMVLASAAETAATTSITVVADSTSTFKALAVKIAAEILGSDATEADVVNAIVALQGDDEAIAEFNAAVIEALESDEVNDAVDAMLAEMKAAINGGGMVMLSTVGDLASIVNTYAINEALDAISAKTAEINAEIADLAKDKANVILTEVDLSDIEITLELILAEGVDSVVDALDEAIEEAEEAIAEIDEDAYMAGDIIVDGKVSAADLIALKNILLENPTTLTAQGLLNADIEFEGEDGKLERDNKINSKDLVGIKSILLLDEEAVG